MISKITDSEIAPARELNASGVLFDMLSEIVYNTKVAYAKKSAHVSILR